MICSFFVFSETSTFAETPPNWPWHGVSMDNLSSTPEDLYRFKRELGINAVRLQLKIGKYAKKKQVSEIIAWDESLKWLNSMLDACAKSDIAGIVNISSFLFNPDIKYKMHSPNVWNSSSRLEHIKTSTKRLVLSLKSRGSELMAFDFLSEPVVVKNRKGRRPEAWAKLRKDISGIVQKNAPRRWLIVSTAPWGGIKGYKELKPLANRKVIYGAHTYLPHAFTHQGIKKNPNKVKYPGFIRGRYWDKNRIRKHLKILHTFQQKHQVPVLIGEFSAVRWASGGETYLKDLTSIFNEYNWSWLYFHATGWHGWNPDYNQHNPGKDGAKKWKNDYIGIKSARWNTLHSIFGINVNRRVIIK